MKIVAIDPDVDKSGIAFLDTESKELKTDTMPFFGIVFDVLQSNASEIDLVVIEGGWLNDKSVFHRYSNARTASFIGKSVGRNHETGRKLVEACEFLKIKYKVVKPLVKCWSGQDRKITHEELQKVAISKKLKFAQKRTNQDARDAGLLAIVYSNI